MLEEFHFLILSHIKEKDKLSHKCIAVPLPPYVLIKEMTGKLKKWNIGKWRGLKRSIPCSSQTRSGQHTICFWTNLFLKKQQPKISLSMGINPNVSKANPKSRLLNIHWNQRESSQKQHLTLLHSLTLLKSKQMGEIIDLLFIKQIYVAAQLTQTDNIKNHACSIQIFSEINSNNFSYCGLGNANHFWSQNVIKKNHSNPSPLPKH